MADEDWPFQVSDKIQDLIFVARAQTAQGVVDNYIAIRDALAAAGVEKATRPAFQAGSGGATLQQATQNASTPVSQGGLGGTPITGGPPPKPASQYPGGDGDLHTSKSCPVCGAPLKITEKVTNKGDRWYRKLECSADYKHTKGDDQSGLVWSEDWKKRRS